MRLNWYGGEIKMKVSFIIPVYKVESYLEQCIDSVLEAWKKEREVIFILGDRTDSGFSICERYQKKEKGISLWVQDGRGLSNARNFGLKKATGDYVLFIDGDDYICSRALKKRLFLLERMEKQAKQKIDVWVSDFYFIYGESGRIKRSEQIEKKAGIWIEKRGKEREEKRKDAFLKAPGSIWNVWRYIYRTDFLRSHSLTFLENTANEDVLFTTRVFLEAEEIAYLHLPYYCYRVRRDGALTTRIGKKEIEDFLNIIEESVRIVEKLENNRRAMLLKEKLQREYLLNLPLLYEVEKGDRKQTGYAVWESRWILKRAERFYGRFFYWWIQNFGVEGLAACFYRIREIRRKSSGIYKKFPEV